MKKSTRKELALEAQEIECPELRLELMRKLALQSERYFQVTLEDPPATDFIVTGRRQTKIRSDCEWRP